MTVSIDDAFKAMPRRHFLPDEVAGHADYDQPLPIGFGQTNSQPSTVAMMLTWLDVQPAHRILDVGSGSGWTTALLAYLTGPEGVVVAVEVVPELVDYGRSNCESVGITNTRFHLAGRQFGWPADAPYDRVLVSAAARSLPAELLEQLAPEGRMVIPIQHSVHVILKDERGNPSDREHPGFAFVPLT